MSSNSYIVPGKQRIYHISYVSILIRAVKLKHWQVMLHITHLWKVFHWNELMETLNAYFSADGKRCLFALWNSFCLYTEKWRGQLWRFWLVLVGLFKIDIITISIKRIQGAQLYTHFLTSSTFALKLFQILDFLGKNRNIASWCGALCDEEFNVGAFFNSQMFYFPFCFFLSLFLSDSLLNSSCSISGTFELYFSFLSFSLPSVCWFHCLLAAIPHYYILQSANPLPYVLLSFPRPPAFWFFPDLISFSPDLALFNSALVYLSACLRPPFSPSVQLWIHKLNKTLAEEVNKCGVQTRTWQLEKEKGDAKAKLLIRLVWILFNE